ncbi:RNA polymerase factor sigma-70 [Bacillus manliponensis]|uniref:RNA polymerase factor sigma-70 n=1 Tax=Bacillus manliponensis TaxID=574376 RepID=A0A073JWW9_9BACI|nr:sigma-70 family RNA polymerase sigma factor [Bacillus manliponensis]KEK18756.1 RNA polymerase factor sigma-70 [Bacillus manliponensis]
MKANEKNFIKRLQRQKEDALNFVVDTYLPLVKGITYKILAPLGNDGVIDECMNDIFLAVWEHANKFDGDAADFKKWITKIAKFKAIDYYRKVTKQVEVTADYVDVEGKNSVEDELILMENRSELIQLINELEFVDREIFIMKYLLGTKTEEIAKKFSLTTSAVDNRVYRGKKKLYKKGMHLKVGGSAI